MKIAYLTLGCKLNYAETSTYARGFKAAGAQTVPWSEQADAYIVNTCSVTATSDAKSRNLVRKVMRVNPNAVVAVTGCSAQLRRSDYESMQGNILVFGCEQKHLVVPTVLQRLGIECPQPDGSNIFAAYSTGERTRSFLKVQDGCENFCAYCTVPYARGHSRNLPICECVRGARDIAAQGVKEIVLTGVNTGDFGRTTGESFLDLLKALNDVDGIERYRISSIEPNLLSDETIDWIATGTKFQPHFHIPLQTGSDVLLKAMGRHYDTAFFAQKMEYIRQALEGPGKPLVFFGLDVMVGLPGETDELFQQTCELLRYTLRPAFIHVFPYSRRPGTPAASMPGQVDEQTKKQRVAQLETMSAALHKEFVLANSGVRERVLFESTCRGGKMEGYTGNYIRIERDYDPQLCGKLVEMTL